MAGKRRAVPLEIKQLVLHESGYKCANPVCRHLITLDIHHLIPVAEDGTDTAENLLPLCPNCHSLHHRGEISSNSIRTWKILLLALNEAYDKRNIDILLALDKQKIIKRITGDGLIKLSSLIASELIIIHEYEHHHKGGNRGAQYEEMYSIELSQKGKLFITG